MFNQQQRRCQSGWAWLLVLWKQGQYEMVIQAQTAWENSSACRLSPRNPVSLLPEVWISDRRTALNGTDRLIKHKPPFPVTGTQHWHTHTHTGVHALLWWITTLASHQISTSMTQDVYHYSQEVNPRAAMQNIPSQCQQDSQTPSLSCNWTGHIFFKSWCFSAVAKLLRCPLLDCFARKSLFVCLGPTSTGQTVCARGKGWDIPKAEHYKPALSAVQKQLKLLLLQVRAACFR